MMFNNRNDGIDFFIYFFKESKFNLFGKIILSPFAIIITIVFGILDFLTTKK
jgi:hypothetical protein